MTISEKIKCLEAAPLYHLPGKARPKHSNTVVSADKFGISNGRRFEIVVVPDSEKPFHILQATKKRQARSKLTWDQASVLVQAVSFGLNLYGNSTNGCFGTLQLEGLHLYFYGERRGRWHCSLSCLNGCLTLSLADLSRLSEGLAKARGIYIDLVEFGA